MRIGRLHTTIVVITVAIAALGCQETKVSWQDFESEEDGFTASFPGSPQREELTVNTAGGPVRISQYLVEIDQLAFIVAVSELPDHGVAEAGPDELLDGARDGAVANVQGTLLSEQIIEVNGFPGRALKISAAGGAGTLKARILLVQEQLLQAMVASPVEDSYRPEISTFLESVSPI